MRFTITQKNSYFGKVYKQKTPTIWPGFFKRLSELDVSDVIKLNVVEVIVGGNFYIGDFNHIQVKANTLT